jgi:hypothetical protein
MKFKPTQEELQAATNATLRAHATSDEAKALVVGSPRWLTSRRTRRSGCSKKQNVVRTHHTDDQSNKMEAVCD